MSRSTRLLSLVLVLGSAAAVCAQSSACVQTPADRKADDKAKSLLCYLSTHTYISGQTDMADAERVQRLTGRFPAMVAFDFYGYTDGNAAANARNTDGVIAFGKRGGLVTIQWHWKAPRPSGRGEYYDRWNYPAALDDPNSQLRRDIVLIMGELKKMGDAGIPVLWRPLHEANNNFMWWQREGTENYRRLWRLLFSEAERLGVHNLVWSFNGMAAGQGTALRDWYPGDAYVDVISSDYYQSWNDYNTMRAIGPSKTLGVAETWMALDPAKDPPFSHSVVWASRDWEAAIGFSNVEAHWRTAMGNSRTISIDQVPPLGGPFADPDSGNLARGMRASASSNDAFGAGPGAAVDGDDATRWSSAWSDGEWLQVDLGATRRVDSVSIAWEAAHATAWEIQVSTDSVVWTRAASRTGSNGGTEGIGFPATNARWVRLLGTTRATEYGISVWEVRVYGPAGGTTSTGVRTATRDAPLRLTGPGRLRVDHDGAYRLEVRDLRGALLLSRRGDGPSDVLLPQGSSGLRVATLRHPSGGVVGAIPVP